MRTPKHRFRGFTLVEAMVATAISSIVLTGAVQGFVVMNRTIMKAARGNKLNDEVKLLQDYVVSLVQATGGGALRPWHALVMGNNNGADSTDTLLLAHVLDGFDDCAVETVSGTNITFAVDGGGTCLCSAVVSGTATGEHIHIVSHNGSDVWHRKVASTNAAMCRITTTNPTAALTDATWWKSNASFNAANLDRSGTNVSSVTFTKTLKMWRTAGEELRLLVPSGAGTQELILAGGVADFQVSLGFDVEPSNGRVDNTGAASDEWLYNHSSDGWNSGGLTGVTWGELRQIGVGVTMKRASAGAPAVSKSVLDGTSKSFTGAEVVSSVAYGSLRNIYVFQ